MQNYYEVLGVTPEADEGVIKGAYHGLAKAFHPDVNVGNALAERRFKEISQAYDTLRDPKTRAAYELGLAHQRKTTRRRISAAAMTGFATSMFSTIVISFVMIWFLTDASRHGPPDKDKGVMRPKTIMSTPQKDSTHTQVDNLVRPSEIGAQP
ncbi:MAG TPA: J domain-containing protein [Hyphomicrobiaceae bacterium]|nr:J domain-containing protein [Hyphomicrobiaceae bacterium]